MEGWISRHLVYHEIPVFQLNILPLRETLVMKKIFQLTALIGVFLNLNIKAQTSYNMESWYSLLTFSYPNGWVGATNVFTGVNCVSKDSTVTFQGNYSAKISTKSLSPNNLSAYFPDTSGFLLTGSLNIPAAKVIQGFPYTTRSSQFGLMTKYTPVGNDDAFIYVALLKRNALGTGTRDTIGSGRVSIGASANFQPTVVNIDYTSFGFPTSTIPDSAYILISSSKKSGGVIGSVLWVDALQWDPPANLGFEDYQNSSSLSFFPQPNNGVFKIQHSEGGASKLVITDMSGKACEIHQLSIGENIIKSQLSDGIYIGSIYNKDAELKARGKLMIAH